MNSLGHFAARRAGCSFRSTRSIASQTSRSHARSFFWKRAEPAIPKIAGKKTLYPERMLIYHAGTGRIVFVGCLKVTTVFIFTFFTAVVTPALFADGSQPIWVPFLTQLAGTVPLAYVAYLSAPFVAYIHLRVPPFARNSKEFLLRYAKTLPKDAELDITTMSFLGRPRATRMKLHELRTTNKRFGTVNFERETKAINAKREWWRKKAVGQFGVHGKRSGFLDGEIWELMKQNFAKNAR